jgi:hypothetical protein
MALETFAQRCESLRVVDFASADHANPATQRFEHSRMPAADGSEAYDQGTRHPRSGVWLFAAS